MKQYHELVHRILAEGDERTDRTGVGTFAIFGHQMRFDLQDGFPLITTKMLHLRSIIHELLWFLGGESNISYLHQNGVTIWDEWADENGDLGPIYGKQWRDWVSADGRHIDQIAALIQEIKHHPASRRQIVTAWNPGDLPQMALAPCHCLFQTAVAKGRLHLLLYQRSCDVFLGLPFNIASYALLLMMLAQQCDLEPGEFIWTGGDVHIYKNHLDQVSLQITREPFALPSMKFRRKPPSMDQYRFEDFELMGYRAHPNIKGEVAV